MSIWDVIGAGVTGLFGLGSSAMSMGLSYGQTKNIQQRQFNWQEKMSNTAYQRATADMREAGLNPIIAGMSQTGASTPSGASGQGANVNLGEGLLNGLSTAAQVQNTRANTNLQNEQAETESTKRQNYEANTTLQHLQAIGENIKNMNMPEMYKRQIEETISRTVLNYTTGSVAQLDAMSNRIQAEASKTNAETNRMVGKEQAKYTRERGRGFSETRSGGNGEDLRFPFGLGGRGLQNNYQHSKTW